MHDHFRQQWQRWLQLRPDPARHIFAGRIVQSGDVIEIVVVELVVVRLERSFDLGEILDPAEQRIDRAGNMQLDAKRMPMQARAFVSGRHVRQPVCCLEGKRLKDVHSDSVTLSQPLARQRV